MPAKNAKNYGIKSSGIERCKKHLPNGIKTVRTTDSPVSDREIGRVTSESPNKILLITSRGNVKITIRRKMDFFICGMR